MLGYRTGVFRDASRLELGEPVEDLGSLCLSYVGPKYVYQVRTNSLKPPSHRCEGE